MNKTPPRTRPLTSASISPPPLQSFPFASAATMLRQQSTASLRGSPFVINVTASLMPRTPRLRTAELLFRALFTIYQLSFVDFPTTAPHLSTKSPPLHLSLLPHPPNYLTWILPRTETIARRGGGRSCALMCGGRPRRSGRAPKRPGRTRKRASRTRTRVGGR
ncbi:unnamed protein product [Chondrus crispus]|uniref:Uncharacterized protein n=1 Tax=Chondrus crispus TaxID=2769 RepID=R7QHC2_CHOCR|nr:unnamed protein product [Chondrus crispus]CDF36825.1 unnamed protein product [Chondrus crispus]|eukprot:XP_005716644.1 unnamed protein product [Chondrus crispus]